MSESQSSTESKSSTSTSSSNADQRLNLAAGGVGGTASSGGVVNITATSTDGGAFDVVRQSVDAVTKRHAEVFDDMLKTHGDGFDGLLTGFNQLLSSGKYLIDANTKATTQSVDLAHDALLAYAPDKSAKTELDSKKTILIAAGIGAAALIFSKAR